MTRAPVCIAILSAAVCCSLSAATLTWSGTGNASNAANWSPAQVPTAADDIVVAGGGNMTWDNGVNGLPLTVNSWDQQASYTGTVTLDTLYAGPETLAVSGNLTINGGSWTHTANGSGQVQRLSVNVGGSFTLGGSGSINVSGRGFSKGNGTGAAFDNGGGGHGGQGGDGRFGYTGAGLTTYGSVTAPEDLGSGGSGLASGGAGGGALQLVVAGSATIAGTISAVGQLGARAGSSFTGGGAGGSVYLSAATILGSGTISADGGAATDSLGGGGGGGRIAVIATAGLDTGSLTLRAQGGVSDRDGAAGTIFTRHAGQAHGDLRVDNGGVVALGTTLVNSAYQLDSVTTTNNGLFELGAGATLDISAGGVLNGDSDVTARIILGGGQINFPAAFTLTTATLSQRGSGTITLATDLTIGSGGILTHEANSTTYANKLNASFSGSLVVLADGLVTAVAQGFSKANGPGAAFDNGGGAHAGQGGNGRFSYTGGALTTYGSIDNPDTLGSGGSGLATRGAGGGVIRLAVSGTATIQGQILADGDLGARAGSSFTGGGAGGSIRVSAANILGAGTLSANGGAATDNLGGGGGGGRIALISSSTGFGTLTVGARGGLGEQLGAAGTVCATAQTPMDTCWWTTRAVSPRRSHWSTAACTQSIARP